MKVNQILKKIVNQKNLTFAQSQFLARAIIKDQLTASQLGATLVALKIKGESVEEILGFIKTMQEKMRKVKIKGTIIDTCGTGGDKSGSFNISTATALVVAGAGVKVAKHGNRGVSSRCGSADVLEKLGVNLRLNPFQAKKVLQKVGMVFLFAPLYHPAMKKIAFVRQELKLPTIFNFLGPMLNPAAPRRQLIGVPTRLIAQKLAKVAKKLNYQHLLIVTSDDGFDEISLSSVTYIFQIRGKRVKSSLIYPEDYGIKRIGKEKLLGGDVFQNAKIISKILEGKKGPCQEIVCLNSAFALLVAGRVKDIFQGISLARESINKGLAKNVLEKLINFSQKYGH